MSDREKLPGDPSLPPGVSQRDIDNDYDDVDNEHCCICGRLLSYKEMQICDTCDGAAEGEKC